MEHMVHQLKLPLPLSDKPDLSRVTNVASVPQRSPFRYPGGKTWLIPYIRLWFASLPTQPTEYVELFTGGGSIGLTVAFEHLAEHVTLVELDDQVSAVWQTILCGDSLWLADQIRDFDLTPENVELALSQTTATLREKAFQTLLKNRVNRGGILAPGAGRIKRGENGKGITSRWYPETLSKRILAIAAVRDRMTFIEGDGLAFLAQNVHRPDTVFFIDPPYTAAGKKAGTRLYTHFTVDHEALFSAASKTAGDFLMTYDDSEEIRRLARQFGLDTQAVAMKNTHHAKMIELLIGRNLDWARQG
jgi:DNA adenine methylase